MGGRHRLAPCPPPREHCLWSLVCLASTCSQWLGQRSAAGHWATPGTVSQEPVPHLERVMCWAGRVPQQPCSAAEHSLTEMPSCSFGLHCMDVFLPFFLCLTPKLLTTTRWPQFPRPGPLPSMWKLPNHIYFPNVICLM